MGGSTPPRGTVRNPAGYNMIGGSCSRKTERVCVQSRAAILGPVARYAALSMGSMNMLLMLMAKQCVMTTTKEKLSSSGVNIAK